MLAQDKAALSEQEKKRMEEEYQEKMKEY